MYVAMEDPWIFWLVFIVVLIVVYLLVRDAQRVSDTWRILQTPISDFHFLLLHEKCPIVIEDGVTDVHLLLSACFAYMYMWWTDLPSGSLWKQSMSKYVVVHNTHPKEDRSVWISHPKESTGSWKSVSTGYRVDVNLETHQQRKYVEVVLHPWQSLVVPCHWLWRTPEPENIQELEINDAVYWLSGCVSRVLS